MNYKTTTIILMLILLVAVIYIGYNTFQDYKLKIHQESYLDGIEGGQIAWSNYVIRSINQDGRIPFITNRTEQYVTLEQLCER